MQQLTSHELSFEGNRVEYPEAFLCPDSEAVLVLVEATILNALRTC